jgi:N-acetylglutamate synthase-like GNAT family acetyltransferase
VKVVVVVTFSNKGVENLVCKAASSFLSDFHFGHVEIEAVTEEVFGNYATRQKSAAAVCSAAGNILEGLVHIPL